MSHTITGAEPKDTKTFFGHPRMLANLFTVEMWERFSFYGMQGIMIYYLYYTADKGGLGLDQALATGVIGAYGAVVYLMAILGGILGDRLLGPERTLFYSAIGIMAGHISLSLIPGIPGVVIGLLLVAIGSGGLKSNASVLVGSLYSDNDHRRDAGFTIFYIGVNTGALIGPILTGWGWSTGGFPPRIWPGCYRYGCRPDSVLADPQEPARLPYTTWAPPSPALRSVTSSWHWSVSWSFSVSCWQPA